MEKNKTHDDQHHNMHTRNYWVHNIQMDRGARDGKAYIEFCG
jgi:hypothetical protein